MFDTNLQIKLNFNLDYIVEDDHKLKLVLGLTERMNLKFLNSLYSHLGRKPIVDPLTMLQIIIFCYSEGVTSCRKIAKMCKVDTRCIYLLDGQKPPSYSAINDFRSKLVGSENTILTNMIKQLDEMGFIDLESIYIDGTKIESYANKYTFVWRKNVERYQENIRVKLVKEFSLDEDITLEDAFTHLIEKFKEQEIICQDIEFVYGSGKRKSQEQKDYEKYEDWIVKLSEYQEHLTIMGDRNSYSKTDNDATFMRMKDDHMMNGQLKPAYNLQLATASDFIIGAGIFSNPSDMYTLIPFSTKLIEVYEGKIKNLVADSGYESIENYRFLHDRNIEAYIKPSNYEQKKKKKYKNEIGRRENMIYIEEEDAYQCKAGKKLTREKDFYKTRKSGYKDRLRLYKCSECSDCPYNKECIKYSKKKNPDTKTVRYSPEFDYFRNQSNKRIISDKGIEERLNRSIQAEGVFSKLKDGLSYTRFRHRGKENVLLEMTLMSIAININTLCSKILRGTLSQTKHRLAS